MTDRKGTFFGFLLVYQIISLVFYLVFVHLNDYTYTRLDYMPQQEKLILSKYLFSHSGVRIFLSEICGDFLMFNHFRLSGDGCLLTSLSVGLLGHGP